MAGFGVDKSKNTTVKTSVDNSNLAADNGANAVRIGGFRNTYVQDDQGSIEKAFALAGQSLQFASDYSAQAASATADTLDLYASESRGTLNEMIALSQSPTQQLTENVFTTGIWALVALAGLFALYSYRKAS